MKNSTKALTVVAAIGLLVAMFGLTTLFSAVDVEEDEVEWTMENGDALAFVKADATYDFYIEDDALETISTEAVHFHDHAASSTVFNVADRTTDQTPNPRVEAPATSGYNRDNPGATPWVTDALPIVRVGGNRVSAFTVNEDTGVVTLNDPTAETVSITFSYHTQDVYGDGVSEAEPGGETSQTTGRARVSSTSDSGGELVEISEAIGVGNPSASPISKVFHGSVVLSSDASKAGSGDGEVWIEDGDTVTVDYLDKDGELIDSDTVTADTVPPTISDISPADGSVSNSEHPTITFDVTDAGSKIASGAAITIMVRGRNVDTVQQPAFQPISDGFRAIFATGKSWTLASSFNVPDHDTTGFTWTIVA